ncbi:MAG TPA: cytochrome P450 [Pseudolysinimonas sp.]|nr:cytochrome P450 [Pseudolysinimonas sp.]
MNYHVIRDPRVVREVFNRPVEFSSANALLAVTPLTAASLRVLERVDFALPAVLASNDGESHHGIRRVVSAYFTPAVVAGLEGRIRELVRAALTTARERLAADGSVDLVSAVAAEPPVVLMFEMLGLPVRDIQQLKVWSRESLELFWGWPDDDRQLHLARDAAEFYLWLRAFVAESIASPQRNLFASLAEHGLSDAQMCSLGYFLLIAGQETTSQLISTTMFRVLDGSVGTPWAELESRQAATAAVRHVLATNSPGPTARRVAAVDVTVGGETIPAGAEVLLELTGNHAPGANGTAYSIAFGSGIHRCLGARLSELEATVTVQEAARVLPDIQLLDRAPIWTELLSFRSPQSVTVGARREQEFAGAARRHSAHVD